MVAIYVWLSNLHLRGNISINLLYMFQEIKNKTKYSPEAKIILSSCIK